MKSQQQNPLTRLICSLLRRYQQLTDGRVSQCRHVPGCSTYALEALESRGTVGGTWLAVKRVCRCHPWGTHGYDPVPTPRER